MPLENKIRSGLQRTRWRLRLLYNFIFTNPHRALTARIVLLSAWFRMRIRFVPMSKLQKSFGTMGKESPDIEPMEHLRTARMIGLRVERVCKKTSWDSKCLVRALVAQRILAKKQIHTTLYLGVRREENGMHAHAWLRCGPVYVTGGVGELDHTVVSRFYC